MPECAFLDRYSLLPGMYIWNVHNKEGDMSLRVTNKLHRGWRSENFIHYILLA